MFAFFILSLFLNPSISSASTKEEVTAFKLIQLEHEMQQFKLEQKEEVELLKAKVESQALEIDKLKAITAPESCASWHSVLPKNEPSLELIDPDGQFVGNPPFQVTCDQGKTIIGEEVKIELGDCHAEDCTRFEVPIDEERKGQIEGLIESSEVCTQKITFDCLEDYEYYPEYEDFEEENVIRMNYSTPCCKQEIAFNCLFNNNQENETSIEHMENSCTENLNIWNKNSLEIHGANLPISAIEYKPMDYNFQKLKINVGPLQCTNPKRKLKLDIETLKVKTDKCLNDQINLTSDLQDLVESKIEFENQLESLRNITDECLDGQNDLKDFTGNTLQLKNEFQILKKIKELEESTMKIENWKCPSGYEMIQKNCILFEPRKMNYKNARRNCLKKKGKLFEPKNEDIEIEILTKAKEVFSSDEEIWIGINDLDQDGTYYYDDGRQRKLEMAKFYHLSNSQGRNCVSAYGKAWWYERCELEFHSICETEDRIYDL